jgi:hypothetical protein
MKPTKLEHYKYFQPIAWTLCVSFAGFVGMLAMQLENEMERMHNSSISFEQRLQNVEAAVGVTPPATKKVQ